MEIFPRYVNYEGSSLGEKYFNGDIYSTNITPEEWKEILIKDYTHVYIYYADERFWRDYGMLFEPGDQPEGGALYIIDPKGKYLLTLVSKVQ